MRTINYILIITTFLLTSCSKDDGEDVNVPTISYTTASLNASFYEPGNSPAPNINWNGEKGNFTLSQNIEGLSVDNATGVIHWTKLLPPGSHAFGVIAKNSAGQTVSNFELDNPLRGVFITTVKLANGVDYEYQFQFKSGQELIVETNAAPYGIFLRGSGAWTQNGNRIISTYEYDEEISYQGMYTFNGQINQTSSNVSYSGILTWESQSGEEEEEVTAMELIMN